ncbi:hypothetical protein B7P43_G04172 [Cryptotermes secundus]|uniref:Secreted protein n=1 Tax=Cryptotermes secundus TaxID=105785 RepID=A0A2J7QXS6_9NEOP|nr:hypothetical protein B7P43_G04172 [Cryptotermes secundus]
MMKPRRMRGAGHVVKRMGEKRNAYMIFVFLLLHVVQTGSGAHSTSHPIGTGGSFPGVKRPERGADHSPATSAEVKKWGIYTSIPPIRLHGIVLR